MVSVLLLKVLRNTKKIYKVNINSVKSFCSAEMKMIVTSMCRNICDKVFWIFWNFCDILMDVLWKFNGFWMYVYVKWLLWGILARLQIIQSWSWVCLFGIGSYLRKSYISLFIMHNQVLFILWFLTKQIKFFDQFSHKIFYYHPPCQGKYHEKNQTQIKIFHFIIFSRCVGLTL